MPSHNRVNGKRPLGLTFWGQWFLAMVVVIAILSFLTWLKVGQVSSSYRTLSALTVFCSIPIYSFLKTYDRQRRLLTVASRITGSWVLLLGILAVVAFLTKTGSSYSREVLIQWSVLGLLAQYITFIPLHLFSRNYHNRQQTSQNVLIIGDGCHAQKLAITLKNKHNQALVGLVGLAGKESNIAKDNVLLPTIGNTANIREIIAENSVKKVYIALPNAEAGTVEPLYIDLLDVNVDVIWVPELTPTILLNHSVSEMGGITAIHLNESPLAANPSAAFLKAIIDRLLAFLAILLFSPLLILICMAIKLSSPGPILFRQLRHGLNGSVFYIYKFRSMVEHHDSEVKQATRNDLRVTKVGRLIRKTSMDELPQFINVLMGDMSLVGPRPHAVAHNDYYANKIQAYMNRHRVKPGITGLAQIQGARGETETLEKMERRLKLDLQYINTWSLLLDIKILLKTPFSLFSKNIY